MRHVLADHATKRTELLADALRDTVAELRLIEAADMIAYVRTGQWANIADLVQSSSEMSFADGSLVFACAADVAVGYAEPATVSLDMEFQHESVTAFFTLTLAPAETRIETKKVWFATSPSDEEAGTRLFSRALTSARLGASAPDGLASA